MKLENAKTRNGWRTVKLGDLLLDCRNGLYKPDTFYGRGTRILKMFNIGRLNGCWELERVDQVEVTPQEKEQFGLRTGDIMFNRVNSRELVGKCAVVDESTDGSVFESKNMRLRLDPTIAEPVFVATFLNSFSGRTQIENRTRQIIGMATVNRSDLDSFEIALPSLTEQKRIARQVEAQMAEVEKARAAVQAQLDTAQKLPAALLRDVFESGKWEWFQVDELAETCSGTTPSRGRQDFYGGKIPWVHYCPV
jgi:type I restriction enzyme S subunit